MSYGAVSIDFEKAKSFLNYRSYKVNLVALTGDPNFPDTQPSNTLLITTGNEDGTRYLDSTASGIIQEPPMEESHDQDDSDMRVRITKITENTVHLDWVTFSEPEGMLYYKVTWSSLVDPEVRTSYHSSINDKRWCAKSIWRDMDPFPFNDNSSIL